MKKDLMSLIIDSKGNKSLKEIATGLNREHWGKVVSVLATFPDLLPTRDTTCDSIESFSTETIYKKQGKKNVYTPYYKNIANVFGGYYKADTVYEYAPDGRPSYIPNGGTEYALGLFTTYYRDLNFESTHTVDCLVDAEDYLVKITELQEIVKATVTVYTTETEKQGYKVKCYHGFADNYSVKMVGGTKFKTIDPIIPLVEQVSYNTPEDTSTDFEVKELHVNGLMFLPDLVADGYKFTSDEIETLSKMVLVEEL